VIDRPANATDIVHVDFTGTINGEPIRGGSAKNYRLDIANNNFIEGFADQIVGHKIGEEFIIKVTFPKDYHDSSLANKPAEFTIKLNEIKRKVVPELTDELARKVGPYESMAQLKDEVNKFLRQNEDQENTYRKQKAVIDAVVDKADVDIPDAMINREAKLLMEEVQQRFKSQGMSWEQFLDSQGHETIWENLRGEAKKRIKTSLVFGAIAKQENIVVSEDEFTGLVREFAQMRNTDEKAIMRQLANHFESAQALSDQILSQKIVDFLLERASFTVVPEAAPAAEGEKKAAPAASSGAASANPAPAQAVQVAAGMEAEEFEVIEDE
jgi:trigger factor